MFRKEKLILVSIERIEGKDKLKGTPFVSHKHEFMTPEGDVKFGYSENDQYKKYLKPTLQWDDSKAHEFLFESKTWNDETKWKLVEATRALGLQKQLGE